VNAPRNTVKMIRP